MDDRDDGSCYLVQIYPNVCSMSSGIFYPFWIIYWRFSQLSCAAWLTAQIILPASDIIISYEQYRNSRQPPNCPGGRDSDVRIFIE